MIAGKCCATTSFGTSLPMSTRCAASRPGQTTSMRMTSISPDFCESSCWNSANCSLESFGTETTFISFPVFFAHDSEPVLQRSNSAPTEPHATETVACAAAERAPRTVPAKTRGGATRTGTAEPTGAGAAPWQRGQRAVQRLMESHGSALHLLRQDGALHLHLGEDRLEHDHEGRLAGGEGEVDPLDGGGDRQTGVSDHQRVAVAEARDDAGQLGVQQGSSLHMPTALTGERRKHLSAPTSLSRGRRPVVESVAP